MSILDLERKIRELCNNPRDREILYEDKIKWNKLWTSLDVIADAQLSIDQYKKLEKFDGFNGGYLYIYGLMQALFLQQDACNNISKSILEQEIDFKTEYTDLYEIREYRNNSIGHPMGRGNDKSFHGISRISISKEGFQLISYTFEPSKDIVIGNIKLSDCIEKQEKLLFHILSEIEKKIIIKNKTHKAKFMHKKIMDLVPESIDYHIRKLYEGVHRDYPLLEMNFRIIKETLEKVKTGINERYHSLSALPGLEDNIERIDYVIARLERTLINTKIDDEMELRIFIDTLCNDFEELVDMLKSCDEEFGN